MHRVKKRSKIVHLIDAKLALSMESPSRVFPSRQASLYGERPEPMKRMYGRTRRSM